MFSWYKYLIVSLVFFPPRFLEWESFSDCAFPDLCLLVPFHISPKYIGLLLKSNQNCILRSTLVEGGIFVNMYAQNLSTVFMFLSFPPPHRTPVHNLTLFYLYYLQRHDTGIIILTEVFTG